MLHFSDILMDNDSLAVQPFLYPDPLGDAHAAAIPGGDGDFTIDCDGPTEDNRNEQSDSQGHSVTKNRLNSSAQKLRQDVECICARDRTGQRLVSFTMHDIYIRSICMVSLKANLLVR
jgi:hypothetical protein